jgi:hypothetical protein
MSAIETDEKKKEEGKQQKEPAKKKRKAKEKKDIGGCKKIRIYPNEEERKILNQWLDACRWTYNQAIEGIQEFRTDIDETSLREYCVNKAAFEQGGSMFGRLRKPRWKIGPCLVPCHHD